MAIGGLGLAQVLKQVGHALMGVGMVWYSAQGGLVAASGLVMPALGQEQVTEIDVADGVSWMVLDRLGIGRPRRRAEIGAVEQGSEIIQGAEVGGRQLQRRQIGRPRRLGLAVRRQRARLLIAQLDIVRPPLQHGFDLLQARGGWPRRHP